jgi:hypothetical protein
MAEQSVLFETSAKPPSAGSGLLRLNSDQSGPPCVAVPSRQLPIFEPISRNAAQIETWLTRQLSWIVRAIYRWDCKHLIPDADLRSAGFGTCLALERIRKESAVKSHGSQSACSTA